MGSVVLAIIGGLILLLMLIGGAGIALKGEYTFNIRRGRVRVGTRTARGVVARVIGVSMAMVPLNVLAGGLTVLDDVRAVVGDIYKVFFCAAGLFFLLMIIVMTGVANFGGNDPAPAPAIGRGTSVSVMATDGQWYSGQVADSVGGRVQVVFPNGVSDWFPSARVRLV